MHYNKARALCVIEHGVPLFVVTRGLVVTWVKAVSTLL